MPFSIMQTPSRAAECTKMGGDDHHFIRILSILSHVQVISRLTLSASHHLFTSLFHVNPLGIRIGTPFSECAILISPPARGPPTLVAHHPILTARGSRNVSLEPQASHLMTPDQPLLSGRISFACRLHRLPFWEALSEEGESAQFDGVGDHLTLVHLRHRRGGRSEEK
ncbi:hypothetical protein PAPYR_5900 [Paratrimastix pyriformis]|uniref:Uncharacterized protein n=1 Tax=Paratrimastix pyriformis TaxID=342808 RepID=A0ABQ8UGI5_9EUKA|nr:hypothetical protein PAPYR_5900 [Paratrimastix pyriformis]